LTDLLIGFDIRNRQVDQPPSAGLVDAEWRRPQTAEGGCPTVQLGNYRF